MRPLRVLALCVVAGMVALGGYAWHRVAAQRAFAARVASFPFDPAAPARYGYRLVFDDEFDDLSGINLSDEKNTRPGFRWYARLFPVWGYMSPPEAFSQADGVLAIAGGQIGTAAPADTAAGYVGTAFSDGAYFEARIAFDHDRVNFRPEAPISKDNWWPSFYSIPIEYLTERAQWPGQPEGYVHFGEDDFFEAWLENDRYGGAVHDWYGRLGCNSSGAAALGGYCDIENDGNSHGLAPNNIANEVPPGTDWKQFHVIGQLWVSGAHTPDHRGFVQFYFDGEPTGDRIEWRNDGSDGVPPPAGDTLFSILDRDHLVVYIGSPRNVPLRVDWVHVWQRLANAAAPR